MNRKESLLFSSAIASLVTIVEAANKKIGGLLAGGRYSSSHSWEELVGMIPYFCLLFLIVFLGAFVYFYYILKKR